jgi:signal transduction histidine kinase
MRTIAKLNLRTRVALAFAALGMIVSICLALIAMHFSESYVNRLVREMLRVEGEYLSQRYAETGSVPHPRARHFYTFVSGDEAALAPPAEIAAFVPGDYQEISTPEGDRHVSVLALDASHRLYLVFDLQLEAVRERRLMRDLVALVLFGTGLSAWLGWAWAGRAIDPVRHLARVVEQLEPSRRGAVPLAPEFAHDEVGRLAEAFDRYQEKLYGYVRRERAFTADASHELRTPLAVIRGAIEVLMDAGPCDAATLTRLKRMQRGADELRDLLDALLVLARNDETGGSDTRTPDLNLLVDSLLNERIDGLRERQVQVQRTGTSHVAIAAPQKVLRVIIGNLLRAVSQFAEGGVLRIDVAQQSVSISLESATSTPNPSRPGLDVREHTLGLGMIRRVCERWGWQLDESVVADGCHAFVLRFG